MIDVHIINAPEWATNIAKHKDILSHVTNVQTHLSDPVDGDLFLARQQAYRLGKSEFVSYVDADDFILQPNFFYLAEDVLRNNQEISSVYSRWLVTKHSTNVQYTSELEEWKPSHHDDWSFPKVHQLIVHRRENIESTFHELEGVKWGYLESWIVNACQMRFGKLHQLDCVAYNWVHYPRSARNYAPMQTSEDVLILARSKLRQFKVAHKLKF